MLGRFGPYFGPIFNNFPLLMHHPRYRRYDHDNAACQSDEDMKPAIHAGLYKYLPETPTPRSSKLRKPRKLRRHTKLMMSIIYRMHFLRVGVDFSVRRRFLVDFRRFCTFCARLKTDPFGWAPSSVDFILAIAILPHAHRDRFGFHFFVDFGLSLAADRLVKRGKY